MKVKSTKTWHKLPVAHAQYFDKKADGTPGDCASWHGYDRSIKLTFAGDIDEQGWIVPFGDLKKVKAWLEYYFDHTAVMPANDPRKEEIVEFNNKLKNSGMPSMFQLRILPYGVSMEMSSLFIWEHVNAYVMKVTEGRCYVERVESIEHDSNSAFIEVSESDAIESAENYIGNFLPMKDTWEYTPPKLLKYSL